VAVVVVIALILVWVVVRNNAKSNEAKPITIGVSSISQEYPYYEAVKASFEKYGAQNGVTIDYVDGEGNQAKQVADIEDFVSKRVDAIVLGAISGDGVGPAIIEANKAGIPVFTIDSPSTAKDAKVVQHYGSDNKLLGKEAGELLIQGLKEKYPDTPTYTVLHLLGPPGQAAGDARAAGIREALQADPKVTVVAELATDFDAAKSQAAVETTLAATPGLQGVITANDTALIGATQGVASAGTPPGRVVLVGIDGQKDVITKVISGEIYGDVAQHPENLGQIVPTIVGYLRGKTDVPALVTNAGTKVSAGNANDAIQLAY
jgi:ribose transport system substrate-binding protein